MNNIFLSNIYTFAKNSDMKYIKYIFLLLIFPFYTLAQDTFNYPVDIVYDEANENYYVTNWADGDGFILKLDNQGNILETYVEGLHYPGGMCLVDDILYFSDNLSIWNTEQLPSYIIGIDVSTGDEVLNFEVSTGNTYLDLMDTDNNGNLYIGNTRNGGPDGIVHKFNIASEELTDLATQILKPFGVCYDYLNDKVIFTHSNSTISYLKSISPGGGNVTTVFYIEGFLEGVIMHPDGHFYISSWGTIDQEWGNEPVYKSNLINNWHYELSNDHNRPFGMCVGHDNHLAVCNWGDNSLSFIDLNLFDIEDNKLSDKNITVYPNPSNGRFTLSLDDINEKEFDLTVTDITGKKIFSEHIINNSSSLEKEYNLENLPKGAYLLMIRDNVSVVQKKLIIY